MLDCKAEMNKQSEDFKMLLREQRLLHKTELLEMKELYKAAIDEMQNKKYKEITDHLSQLESDVKNCIDIHNKFQDTMPTTTTVDAKTPINHTSSTTTTSPH